MNQELQKEQNIFRFGQDETQLSADQVKALSKKSKRFTAWMKSRKFKFSRYGGNNLTKCRHFWIADLKCLIGLDFLVGNIQSKSRSERFRSYLYDSETHFHSDLSFTVGPGGPQEGSFTAYLGICYECLPVARLSPDIILCFVHNRYPTKNDTKFNQREVLEVDSNMFSSFHFLVSNKFQIVSSFYHHRLTPLFALRASQPFKSFLSSIWVPFTSSVLHTSFHVSQKTTCMASKVSSKMKTSLLFVGL